MFEWFKEWFFEISRQVIDLPISAAAPTMVLVGALDSSLLSLPEVNDYITITRIAHLPHEVYFFPLFPAIGSMLGCLLLYRIVRGGERMLERRFKSEQLDRIKKIYRRWGLLALVIPALLPPPMPFKIFVVTAGALGYPMGRFALVIFVARAARYYFWGFLAYFFREQVLQVLSWLEAHFFTVLGATLALVALVLLIRWLTIKIRSRATRERTHPSYSVDN
ncbi:MAG: VTT domain-containing protein [Acidobacteriota bacterium]